MSLKQELGDWILTLPGVELRPSRFGGEGEAFCLGRREFAHFHAGNELDLRLTKAGIRAERAALDANPKVTHRGGDWVEVRFPRRADLAQLKAWIELAHASNGGS